MTEGFEVCLPAGTWVGPLIQVEPSIQLLQALEWRMNWWIFMDFYLRIVTFFLRYYPTWLFEMENDQLTDDALNEAGLHAEGSAGPIWKQP
jgi:hypothetical protein